MRSGARWGQQEPSSRALVTKGDNKNTFVFFVLYAAKIKPNGKQNKKPYQHPAGETKCIVLVGTYKGDQLAKWRGWYDYPISDDELSRAETQSRGESELVADCDKPWFSKINELWLFNGKKNERRYKAEFVGVKAWRRMITTWVDDSMECTSLADYANREYPELIRDYYLPRWKHFFAHPID